MKRPKPFFDKVGYTLTEVILAMGVIAVAVPLILGLVVVGGERSRQAEWETRAVMTVRTVFEELRRARDGQGDFIEAADLPWGEATATSLMAGGDERNEGEEDWLIFELNHAGEILGKSEEMEYEERWEGEGSEVVSLATVRGYFQEVEGVALVAGEPLSVFFIEVRIESPARAEAKDRTSISYLKSDSLK